MIEGSYVWYIPISACSVAFGVVSPSTSFSERIMVHHTALGHLSMLSFYRGIHWNNGNIL